MGTRGGPGGSRGGPGDTPSVAPARPGPGRGEGKFQDFPSLESSGSFLIRDLGSGQSPPDPPPCPSRSRPDIPGRNYRRKAGGEGGSPNPEFLEWQEHRAREPHREFPPGIPHLAGIPPAIPLGIPPGISHLEGIPPKFPAGISPGIATGRPRVLRRAAGTASDHAGPGIPAIPGFWDSHPSGDTHGRCRTLPASHPPHSIGMGVNSRE